ncbi:hypothetical protein [Companilactobacillus futsaii]|uniref:hypothetical protein n=1 Tax=Companilactobacillus futsaii TaxID=938155 RepID=UPI00189ED7A2|nr:hypothetical protein [Companilactobacillus futsaii]
MGKINWIKPEKYPVKDGEGLNFEATQTYQDLVRWADENWGKTSEKYYQLKNPLMQLWTASGKKVPKWLKKSVFTWSDKNILDFVEQSGEFADDHFENAKPFSAKCVEELMERDRTYFQAVQFKRLKDRIEKSPEQGLKMENGLIGLIAESKSNVIKIDEKVSPTLGCDYLRGLSRKMSQRVTDVAFGNNQSKRYVKVDLTSDVKESLDFIRKSNGSKEKIKNKEELDL